MLAALISFAFTCSATASAPAASASAPDPVETVAKEQPQVQEPHPYIVAPPPAAAPRPGNARGLIEKKTSVKAKLAWIPRAVLYIPRRVIELATFPLRFVLVAYDRYALRHRLERVFFDEKKEFGIWPVLFVETGFGANAGARVVHNDLFGRGERLWLRASWGGLYRQIYQLQLDSGSRFGRLRLALSGRYQAQPQVRFFGIGNGPSFARDDAAGLTQFEPRLDPVRRNLAVDTRYGVERTVGAVHLGYQLGPQWRLEATQSLAWTRFGPADVGREDPQLALVYDTRRLVGYRRGLLSLYQQVALEHDGTEPGASYLPRAMPARGWRARGYAGYAEGLAFDHSRYGRVGAEIQRFFDLYGGDRILSLRGRADWVIGAFDKIPFTELVELGGPDYLRGYVRGRFRDTFATIVSAEYFYPISQNLSGFLFVDVGRVWHGPQELFLRGIRDVRVGYGGGIQMFANRSFLARLQLATSTESGVFLQLRFNPSFRLMDYT